MLGLLIVTHGRLGEELRRAAETIVGPQPAMEAVAMGGEEELEAVRERLHRAVEKLLRMSDGVLVLTDMFGGTPSNLALSLLDPQRLEVVTGVNLPMLIKFCNVRDRFPLEHVAREVAEKGREAIHVASRLLAREPESEKP